jgi:hypothetical protein
MPETGENCFVGLKMRLDNGKIKKILSYLTLEARNSNAYIELL